MTEALNLGTSIDGHPLGMQIYIKDELENNKICLDYVKAHDYYFIAPASSKLMEFAPGGLYKDAVLVSGRLAYVDRWIDDETGDWADVDYTSVKKRYNKYVRWLRKNFKNVNHYLVGPGAVELAKKGIKLKYEALAKTEAIELNDILESD